MLVQRTAVSSTNIASIGYDPSSKTLEVEFLNRAVYQYYNVSQNVYNGLMSAGSHGSYLDMNVKKAGYSYKQIN